MYHRLLTWLSKHGNGFQTEKVSVHAEDSDSEDESDNDESDRLAPERRECKLEHSCGYGTHHFQYKGVWIKVERKIRKDLLDIFENIHEYITLTTTRWNKSVIREILERAKPKPAKVGETKLSIYRADSESRDWIPLGHPKKKRSLNSIILDGDVTKNLMSDLNEFLSLEDWYVEMGIPHRRGYLLYGPPGCGKSSIIKAIAGELGYDICMLSLSSQLCDDVLTEMLSSAPTKSIILLEDIDAAFKSREDQSATARETNLAFEGCSPSSLTFRGLLNALDGVGSAEDGQIIFMTTNYPDRLDPALVRPGRVDLKVFIDHPNDFQLEGMFKKFYPEASQELRTQFVKEIHILDIKVSMAMVQGLFLIHKKDAQAAMDNLQSYYKNQYAKVKELCNGLYC